MVQHAWEKPAFTAAVSEIWARIERIPFLFIVISTRVSSRTGGWENPRHVYMV
jgi:hypothetical protein